MNEALLQFIWQWNLYRPENLCTTDGQPVTVLQPGLLNRDAGPDFQNARIRIGATLLAGHVEMHLQSSQWMQHRHQEDAAYNNVVLHVVLRHDAATWPSGIPVLELEQSIPEPVVALYKNLVLPERALPCAPYLAQVSGITKESRLARMLAERWEERQHAWEEDLLLCKGDWQTLLYHRLCASLGFKVNKEPFLMLARSLPLSILQRHHAQPADVEALLFGQAGFLSAKEPDDFTKDLARRYDFFKTKYSLSPLPTHLWKFLRMRPANFPTVRLAQFAALFCALEGQLSVLLEPLPVAALALKLMVAPHAYWDTHYRLSVPSARAARKNLGESAATLLLINTIAPVQWMSARAQGNAGQQDSARDMLEALPAEENNIVGLFETCGMKPRHAGHTQGMLQLYHNYCAPRRCLECSIGLSILKRRPHE